MDICLNCNYYSSSVRTLVTFSVQTSPSCQFGETKPMHAKCAENWSYVVTHAEGQILLLFVCFIIAFMFLSCVLKKTNKQTNKNTVSILICKNITIIWTYIHKSVALVEFEERTVAKTLLRLEAATSLIMLALHVA